jgi:hypothetical protein
LLGHPGNTVMSECYAVALEVDGYEFTPSDKGDIHLCEVAERGDLRTITMEQSEPATTLIKQLDIEEFYVKSTVGETGEIGLHIEKLDRFIDGAQLSPHSITVADDVKAYIESES